MMNDAIANLTRGEAATVHQALSVATEISKRSLTALFNFCLLPIYRSVVWMKSGQAEIESVRVLRCNHGRVGRKCDEGRGVPDGICRPAGRIV